MIRNLREILRQVFGKKGDIGYSYIIMIVLGILGVILILYIFRDSFSSVGGKVLSLLEQTPNE